jgi:D-alanyl-lipoteichoic acid acyltransferase DltB (MBOAT superfamily)
MLFNSAEFLIFFPLVVMLFFATPHRYRWILLLAASYYFYMSWKVEYALLIGASTLVSFYAARQMGRLPDQRQRRKFLVLSLCFNLGVLFGFKYFNFFNDSARAVFDRFNLFYGVPAFRALLPVGISFYTFQALSYVIDVYRGEKEPEAHLGIFALYVSFFPQLVAGPIERSVRLLPQFHEVQRFNSARIADGLKLMAWGFFKKLVIADRVALLVDSVYNDPTQHTSIPLILATYFFAFQIYCDFSGYSDIAIGAARVMGYDLMENFNRPYFAKSIAEFWRRWHISLSTWFRDYLYIPLGGNRVSRARWYLNLMIVFVVSGLWHGAAWTFVVWGALHGLYLVLSLSTVGIRERVEAALGFGRHPTLAKGVRVFMTFNLVCFAWIFFRANSISDAFYIAGHLFSGIELQAGYGLGLGPYQLALALLAILVMELGHLLQRRGSVAAYLNARPVWVRWAAYYGLVLATLLFGRLGVTEFIYFQF